MDTGIQPMPHFGLLMTNRLQVLILSGSNVLDYVQLGGMDSSLDIFEHMGEGPQSDLSDPTDDGFWDTNFPAGMNNVPIGVLNQIHISEWGGTVPGKDRDPGDGSSWASTPVTGTPTVPSSDFSDQAAQQAFFKAFFSSSSTAVYRDKAGKTYTLHNTLSKMQAPYTISRTIVSYTSWQANDPLVHYLTSDLNYIPSAPDNILTSGTVVKGTPVPLTLLNLGQLNNRFMPWGGNPLHGDLDPNPFDHTIKDPLIYTPDNWDFPANKLPTTGWMGRVHRGTPWQTVYLKSSDVLLTDGIGTWENLTGNPNPFDATNTAPVQDRLLFDLFTTAFNDNATRGTLSVNQSADQYDSVANPAAGLAAWSALFSGIVVPNPTNTANYATINPAGPNAPVLNPPLWQIVTNINGTRSYFTNVDGLVGVFEHKGDILSVPQLSNPSLFFNGLNPTNQISDEMYEWLPQQVMSLVRVGTPRYVIYSYGQALKPAPTPNGVYLGNGSLLVTNYQVMSETATRAVVRLDTVRTNANGVIIVTPPRAVIESFNILPPD
jgi:hypothetical protein